MQILRRPLDVLEVKTPCPADWDAMNGDDQLRFCGHCNRHVHNLSAMTEDAATRLLCERAGQLCVRFSRDSKGRTATLEYQSSRKGRVTWPVWAFLGAGLAVCSWVIGVVAGVPRKPMTGVMMGAPMPASRPNIPTVCPPVAPATTNPASGAGA